MRRLASGLTLLAACAAILAPMTTPASAAAQRNTNYCFTLAGAKGSLWIHHLWLRAGATHPTKFCISSSGGLPVGTWVRVSVGANSHQCWYYYSHAGQHKVGQHACGGRRHLAKQLFFDFVYQPRSTSRVTISNHWTNDLKRGSPCPRNLSFPLLTTARRGAPATMVCPPRSTGNPRKTQIFKVRQ